MAKQLSKQEKIEFVREYLASGLSQRKFYDQGTVPVNLRNFERWCVKYKPLAKLADGYLQEGHDIKGVSTMYDGEGNIKLQWVKTSKEAENLKEYLENVAAGLSEDIPKYERIVAPKSYQEDLCCVIPIGDAHIGMFAWDREVGDGWDLETAERRMCGAFDYLAEKAPSCEKCVIINVGDYFHYSKMEPTTERSGHVLDAAGRPQEMVRVGMKILKYAITKSAKRHKHVEVINVPGNHDGLLAFFINGWIEDYFSNNPRITVNQSKNNRAYTRFGKNLFGVVHGDKTKDAGLPLLMAENVPELWGETKHRHWYRGHHHSNSQIDHGRTPVEMVSTLASPDAYADWAAYVSRRNMKAIIYHAESGEEERYTCSIERLKMITE